MNRLYKELEALILETVREKAQEVPVFRDPGNGAIRILAYPLCLEADIWLGGKGKMVKDEHGNPILDAPDYETTYAIKPGHSRVIQAFWDDAWHPIDCYAYSALKIAHCSRADELCKGLKSGLNLDDPYLIEENGYASYRGALCVEISEKIDNENPTKFCYIYVCVSGAKDDEDEACAKPAIDVIKKFFKDEGNNRRMYIFRTPQDPSTPPRA